MPELLPVSEPVPRRVFTRQLLCMSVPIAEQDALNRYLIGTAFVGSLSVVKDPFSKGEARLLKVCCAKTDMAHLPLPAVVPCPAPCVGFAVATGFFSKPVGA